MQFAVFWLHEDDDDDEEILAFSHYFSVSVIVEVWQDMRLSLVECKPLYFGSLLPLRLA